MNTTRTGKVALVIFWIITALVAVALFGVIWAVSKNVKQARLEKEQANTTALVAAPLNSAEVTKKEEIASQEEAAQKNQAEAEKRTALELEAKKSSDAAAEKAKQEAATRAATNTALVTSGGSSTTGSTSSTQNNTSTSSSTQNSATRSGVELPKTGAEDTLLRIFAAGTLVSVAAVYISSRKIRA